MGNVFTGAYTVMDLYIWQIPEAYLHFGNFEYSYSGIVSMYSVHCTYSFVKYLPRYSVETLEF